MSLWSKYNRTMVLYGFEGIKRANPTLLGWGATRCIYSINLQGVA